MILAWICIGLGLIGLLFVINFLVKMHNWKWVENLKNRLW